jgi:hypothetical protein
MKITVDVAVGAGVSVFRVGVGDGVHVEEGRTAAVCVAAALTVCAMKVLTAPASTVGTAGVAMAGTQAITSASAVTQTNHFVLCVVSIASSSHLNKAQPGCFVIFQQ